MDAELIIWLIALCGWGAGWWLMWRVPRCRAVATQSRPAVSVVIPARNEENNLPGLLRSLAQQDPPLEEVIVVDDGSSDRTAEVALEQGARVVTSAPLPDGWRGKAWACQQGADVASHDLFLFLDADTRLEPDAFAAMTAQHALHGGALSIAAYQHTGRISEQLQAVFVWVMTAASGAFTPLRKTTGLFGPCLLISKEAYDRVGGHAAVREQVLEHLAMGRRLQKQGCPIQSVCGRGILSIRMYPDGMGSMCRGWRKAFVDGAGWTPPGRMMAIIFWLSAAAAVALMLPIALITSSSMLLWGALYLVFVRQMMRQFRQLGQFTAWTALFYPAPLFFFFGLFALSSVQKEREWKGRRFSMKADEKGAE